ncbi:MAG: TIGR02679 family protein [Egibacteraceae bacterium]
MTSPSHATDVAERLRATLGTPELDWLIGRVRRRLERGDPINGTAVLRDPTAAQRAALEALLGRTPRNPGRLTIDLAELDLLVRHAGLADGLADAIVTLTGPFTDRRAETMRWARAWADVIEEAMERVERRPPLDDWLRTIALNGLLTRLSRRDPKEADRLLTAALDVTDRLPAQPVTTLARLAAETLDDSHALDYGRPEGTLAIRAAAALSGIDLADDANGRRDTWASVGVLCDELSAPVLALNLRAGDRSLTSRALTLHAESGEPARLTLRQLLRHQPQFSPAITGATVFACENPAVVAVAADRLGPASAPLVCLDGQRKTAARTLLGLLGAAGIQLAYHGDFDWGGIRIGNVMVRDHAARPWRFSTPDYQATRGGAPLSGDPVPARWDPALAPALQDAGRAVHEEQLLDDLLTDLAQ